MNASSSAKLVGALLLVTVALGCAALHPGPIVGVEQVHVERDIVYRDDPPTASDETKRRHLLDIYLPTTGAQWPTVLIVHGGGFVINDKAIVDNMGYALAQEGYAVVACNYRLYPRTTHPGPIEDVAAAIAWTKANLPRYGGNTDDYFLIGYSAGGTLAAMALLDERWLAPHGLSVDIFRAAVLMSGIYEVDRIPFPLRFAFTQDPEVWRDASPLRHVRAPLPPLLLLHAEHDWKWGWGRMSMKAQAHLLYEKLRAAGNDVTLREIPDCNHDGIEMQIGRDPASATFAALRAFLARHR
ncbi:MAG TPA: alpha/beta hydrolase [bacterium]|nr:alpha/beta hydrolase [bacterium]